MSDPVTNRDIEDVLSSIRRLVSNDARPLSRPLPSDLPEKLVLTPAQRVARGDAEPTEADHSAPMVLGAIDAVDADGRGADREMSGKGATSRSDTARPDAAIFQTGRDRDAIMDKALLDMVESELTEAMAARARTNLPAASDDTRGTSARRTPVTRPGPDGEVAAAAKTLEQKIAELENLIAEGGETWNAEDATDTEEPPMAGAGGPEDDTAGDPVDELIWNTTRRTVPDRVGRPAASAPSGWQDAPGTERGATTAMDRQTLPAGDPADGTPTHAANAGQTGAPVHADADPATGANGLIDREMLHSLVSDILRQELQGVLGERITRNVRKLVRREIQRALMSQPYE